jgi:hypothetical protein
VKACIRKPERQKMTRTAWTHTVSVAINKEGRVRKAAWSKKKDRRYREGERKLRRVDDNVLTSKFLGTKCRNLVVRITEAKNW